MNLGLMAHLSENCKTNMNLKTQDCNVVGSFHVGFVMSSPDLEDLRKHSFAGSELE